MSTNLLQNAQRPTPSASSDKRGFDARLLACAFSVVVLVVVFACAYVTGSSALRGTSTQALPPVYDAPASVVDAVAITKADGTPMARVTIRVVNMLNVAYRADCFASVWKSPTAFEPDAPISGNATGVNYEYPMGLYDKDPTNRATFTSPSIPPHNAAEFTVDLPQAPTATSLQVDPQTSFATCTISPSRN